MLNEQEIIHTLKTRSLIFPPLHIEVKGREVWVSTSAMIDVLFSYSVAESADTILGQRSKRGTRHKHSSRPFLKRAISTTKQIRIQW